MSCSITLNNLLFVLKNISNLIFIIAPILAIICVSILFIHMVKNPDDKKGLPKIKNSLLALVIIFFIPMIVTTLFYIIGNDNEVVACYFNSSSIVKSGDAQYIEMDEKDKTMMIEDSNNYEKGKPKTLDFDCKSSIVKAQFSCDTLKIVEKHLYDLNAQNFYNVINQYGGFDNYAKSLGGIFGEYYGKKIDGRTEKDFQMAAEYVLGWMFMYGWDYAAVHNSLDGVPDKGCCYAPWGLTKHTPDAFYVNGGFKRKYVPDWPNISYLKQPDNTDFDHVISGKNGVDGMASECGDLVGFTYNKLGLKTKKRIAKITRLRDLKVGDSISYSNDNGGGHVNMVGEVYSDHIVFYDGGRYMQGHLDYKRSIYFPSTDSKAADDAAILKEYGMNHWEGNRWYEFQK